MDKTTHDKEARRDFEEAQEDEKELWKKVGQSICGIQE